MAESLDNACPEYLSGLSVLKKSVLGSYVICGDEHSPSDRAQAFSAAVDAFESECLEALSLPPLRSKAKQLVRIEPLRPFIIKTMLYLGVLPEDKKFAIVARILENSVVRPDSELNDILNEMAALSGYSVFTLTHFIDDCFNTYDQKFYARLTHLTKTPLYTSKDALCDLALYIRLNYYGGNYE